MLSAIVTGTALNARGRPEIPAELDGLIGPSIQ
jgi:acyl-CoA thioester hydrolase